MHAWTHTSTHTQTHANTHTQSTDHNDAIQCMKICFSFVKLVWDISRAAFLPKNESMADNFLYVFQNFT